MQSLLPGSCLPTSRRFLHLVWPVQHVFYYLFSPTSPVFPDMTHLETHQKHGKTGVFHPRKRVAKAMYPCGFRGDPKKQCSCTPMQVERYLGRISGPLLDRIDIHIEVPPVPFRELSDSVPGTSSAEMRELVVRGRQHQIRRFRGLKTRVNGKMKPPEIRKFCKLAKGAEELLRAAMEEMGLSARAHDKILRIARTIADLADSDTICEEHLSEAINYRTLDRNYWQQ